MKVWSWRQVILRSSLASTTKLVLLALSSHMNDHGEGCYPSLDTIAQETSLTRKAVITHIANAVAAGLLVKDRLKLSGRKWASNEYRAAIPPEMESGTPDHQGVQEVHPITNERGEAGTPEGCTSFPHGVYDVHTNSSENSTLNPKELSPKGKKSYPQEFEQFWMAWPAVRRCEKPNAYTAWREACRKNSADALMTALQRYVLTKEAMDGFAPYPAKWLKRERWLEFMPEASPAQATSTLDKQDHDTPETAGWLVILQHLRSKYGDAVCRSWFSQLRIVDKQDGQMVLHAPTRFVAEWVRSHYTADIAQAAQSVWPELADVRIEGSAKL
jgi:hypothetical protein